MTTETTTTARKLTADEQCVLDAAEIAIGAQYMDHHPHELARMAEVQGQLYVDGFDTIRKFRGLTEEIDLHAGRTPGR